MTAKPEFFASPQGVSLRLEGQAQLASWNAASHPDQVKLKRFLDHAVSLVRGPVQELAGPLAMRLDVGVTPPVKLLDRHDLDNYAFPLASAVRRETARELVSVWCSKAVAGQSTLTVGNAIPAPVPNFDRMFWVRTTASASKTAYKEQIHAQARKLPALPPDGPIALQIAFAVSPARNWLNLWKATIDSLDPLLGPTPATHHWHPSDGRIVELGLHCTIDANYRYDVGIVVGATALEDPGR